MGGLVEVLVIISENLVDVRVNSESSLGTERGGSVGP